MKFGGYSLMYLAILLDHKEAKHYTTMQTSMLVSKSFDLLLNIAKSRARIYDDKM
jgi:hypothetical protein